MTEEYKDRLRTEKVAVSERLAGVDISAYQLSRIDRRIEVYCREVADHPQAHNLYEQLAVERFFRMVDKYGLNAVEVLKFFALYENLYFPGKTGLQNLPRCRLSSMRRFSVFGRGNAALCVV